VRTLRLMLRANSKRTIMFNYSTFWTRCKT